MNPDFLNALRKLRREIGPVVKTARGHQYRYADLAEVHRVIDGPLHDNGFVLWHEFECRDGQAVMHTRLVHAHGALGSTLPLSIQSLGGMNFYQALGSAITYLRRYAIMALLGLPAEDDDAEAARRRPAPRGAPATPQQPAPGRAPPPKAEDAQARMRRFLAGGDLHLPVPSMQGRPCPEVWAEKFLALLKLAGEAALIDRLAAANGETLGRLASEHKALSARVTAALRARQAEVGT